MNLSGNLIGRKSPDVRVRFVNNLYVNINVVNLEVVYYIVTLLLYCYEIKRFKLYTNL